MVGGLLLYMCMHGHLLVLCLLRLAVDASHASQVSARVGWRVGGVWAATPAEFRVWPRLSVLCLLPAILSRACGLRGVELAT